MRTKKENWEGGGRKGETDVERGTRRGEERRGAALLFIRRKTKSKEIKTYRSESSFPILKYVL